MWSERLKRFPIVLLAVASLGAAPPNSADYRSSGVITLGAPDRWDYVVFAAGRVYVAHGDRVTVVDAKTRAIVGEVTGLPGGTHGTAIGQGRGFTDDGKNGSVAAFDLRSLKITATAKADDDADGMVADAATGHIFVISGDPGTITVIDARTAQPVATIKGGEKMEYAASDGQGTVYVAGEANSDLLRIDARTNQITGRWKTPGCASPHGLAYDPTGKRLFMGCINSIMMVIDAANGSIVAQLPIGKESDAIAFDPVRKRVFSSNGRDGTVSVYQQRSPDSYDARPDIMTAISARTMAVDPSSGQLFVAGADTTPNPAPGKRPQIVPGSLRLMVFDPTR